MLIVLRRDLSIAIYKIIFKKISVLGMVLYNKIIKCQVNFCGFKKTDSTQAVVHFWMVGDRGLEPRTSTLSV